MSRRPATSLFDDLPKSQETYSDLTVLSMGLGQDSHTILFKIVHDPEFRRRYVPGGRLLVLFADTGNEHDLTYKYRDEVTIPFCKKHGIEFISITNDMGYHARTWQSLTGQWENGTPTIGSLAYNKFKTCTHKLKLEPQWRYVERYISENYDNIPFNGCKKGYTHFAKYYGKIRWLIGIARGEEKRLSDPTKEDKVWKRQSIVVEYPLIDVAMNRTDCQNYIKELGYPIPMPSNCMYCQYGCNDMEILWMYHAYPDNFHEWAAYEQAKLDAHEGATREVTEYFQIAANGKKIPLKKADIKSGRITDFQTKTVTEDVKNLGVAGRLHKEGSKKGSAVTLYDVLREAQAKYPNITLEQLQEYKWSHGHCVESQY